jgi:Ca2+-binding EF-hand superfamily protein
LEEDVMPRWAYTMAEEPYWILKCDLAYCREKSGYDFKSYILLPFKFCLVDKEELALHVGAGVTFDDLEPAELLMLHFSFFDADKNLALDGTEMIQSLIHRHWPGQQSRDVINKEDENISGDDREDQVISDAELDAIVSGSFALLDLNADGYLELHEMIMGFGEND